MCKHINTKELNELGIMPKIYEDYGEIIGEKLDKYNELTEEILKNKGNIESCVCDCNERNGDCYFRINQIAENCLKNIIDFGRQNKK